MVSSTILITTLGSFLRNKALFFKPGPSQQITVIIYIISKTCKDDIDAMCSNIVMCNIPASKIFIVGRSFNYNIGPSAIANTHILTLRAAFQDVGVTQINHMWFQRTFHKSAVLLLTAKSLLLVAKSIPILTFNLISP